MLKTKYAANFLAVLFVTNLIEMETEKAIITIKRYLDMFHIFSKFLPFQLKIYCEICIADMMDLGMVLNTAPRHFYLWIL